MAQGQQGGEGSGDALDILWIAGLVVVVAVLAWYMGGGAFITKYGLTLKKWQLIPVRWWYMAMPSIKISVLGIDTKFTLNEITRELNFIERNIGSEFSAHDFNDVLRYVGNFWRYIYAVIMLVMAAALVLGNRSARNFRKVFNTASLRKSEQSNWPQITPVVKLNLVDVKLDDGPWAMARSPMNYCKFHKLLIVNRNEQGQYDVKLNKSAASKLLEEQLGVKWQGIEQLPVHTKALFAIFATRIAGDKKASEQLLDRIARSSGGDRLDVNGMDELLMKYANNKIVREIVSKHAYVNTVMASMLEGARSLGVLASSEFLWLKPIDRKLWYMLNSVGRSTAVAEICGAFAHWIAEIKNDGPLFAPMIGEAIKGLEIALSEIIYHPDEEGESK